MRRKWLSVQIRKCLFVWEDLQKYYLGTPIHHIIPESFEGFHSREKLDHLVRGVHDLKDAAQRIRYIKRVRWVKGGEGSVVRAGYREPHQSSAIT